MTLNRQSFTDLFFTTALPNLEDVAMEQFESKPDMIPMVFNMETSDKWGEQDTGVSGLGLVPTKAENANVSYDDVYQTYDKTYTHLTYALAVRYSKEMLDDEKWGLINKLTKALGRSMFNTRQIQAASIFNNAFTAGAFAGSDGAALCSTTHPLIAGGTASNNLSPSADLSVTSLREMCNQMEDVVDDRGLLVNIDPRYLLIPNELIWDAEELLKSALRPDNSSNAINAFQVKKVDYMVWNYLTDPDAFWLLSDKDEHALKFIDREAVNTSSDVDWDADAGKVKIRGRFSYGFSDWRGVQGSQGA